MTNEEAREVLQEQIDKYGQEYDAEGIEALEMAIKALEQEPILDKIKAEIIELRSKQNVGVLECLDIIDKYITELNPSYNSVKTELESSEDCISRQKLLSRIDAERKHLLDLKMDGAEHIIVHHARRIIEDMPSVTPKPKRGKWKVIRKEYEFMGGVVNEAQGCKCSNCGGIVKLKSDFCPNCGADMAESEDKV